MQIVCGYASLKSPYAPSVEHLRKTIWQDPTTRQVALDGFFSRSGHTNNWAVLVSLFMSVLHIEMVDNLDTLGGHLTILVNAGHFRVNESRLYFHSKIGSTIAI